MLVFTQSTTAPAYKRPVSRFLAVLLLALTSTGARGDAGPASRTHRLQGDSDLEYTFVAEKGLVGVHIGERLFANGSFLLKNIDKRMGLGDGNVRLGPVRSATIRQGSAGQLSLIQELPDASVTYHYIAEGNDLQLEIELTNKHESETLHAIRLDALNFGITSGNLRGSYVGWYNGYLYHPLNRKYVFLKPGGRTKQRQMLAMEKDTGIGFSASPRVVDRLYPTFLVNMHAKGNQTFGGRRMKLYNLAYLVRVDLKPGQTARLGFTLRILPDKADWTKLLAPYLDFWRQTRLNKAESKAESEAIKQLKAEGAPAGALDTVRKSEAFQKELAKRRNRVERDLSGYLAPLLPKVKVGWYPSINSLILPVDLGPLERTFPNQLTALNVQVTDTTDNRSIADASFSLSGPEDVLDRFRRGRLRMRLPELEEGEYRATVTIDGFHEGWGETFTWKQFEWLGNSLGETDQVLEPFKPIEREGNVIRTVLREYNLDGLGMPASVLAKGQELLAGPIRLIVDGETPLEGKGEFTSAGPQRVEYRGRAEHPAITVESRTVTDYDGCMRVELTLGPADIETSRENVQSTQNPELGTLNTLTLDIPLRDEMAELWHVTTSGLRSNPYGNTPGGDGVVWTSRTMWSDQRPKAKGRLLTNFKPYIWLGKNERGLAWFADNDKGWVLDLADKDGKLRKPQHQPPLQEVIRKDGQLILRLHLVQRPVRITEPRIITFGLMATPTKPMPEDWRRWTTTTHNLPESHRYITWMMQYWGSDTNWANRYPRNRDLTVLDKMEAVRRGQKVDWEAYLAEFKARNYAEGMREGWKKEEQVMSLIGLMIKPGGWMTHGPWRDRDNIGFAYYEEMIACNPLHEEFQVYGDEWTGSFGRRVAISAMVDSYRDFGVWYGREFLKRGFGLYFDNVFPERTHDPVTTDAYPIGYADERLGWDGERIQPGCRLWNVRDYLRRHWVVSRTHGAEEFTVGTYVHMTNTDIAPWLTYADVILDMEYPLYNQPRQKWFKPSMLRAACFGRRTGSIPTAFTHIGGPNKTMTVDEIDRTRFGVLMTHEIRPSFVSGHGKGNKAKASRKLYSKLARLGYGSKDCTVWNYWQDGYPVTASDPQAKSLLFRHDGQLVLLVCTWNPAPATVTFTVEPKTAGINPALAVNAEHPKQTSAITEGEFKLSIPGYGVKMLILKPQADS